MTNLPLGVGAYKRTYGGEPEIELKNRFLEQNPTNLIEKIALLTRCGTNELNAFSGGQNRGQFTKPGLFGGDLFVVSGPNLWRYAEDGTKRQIVGTINGTGHPITTWQKGIGYERLFIGDGLLLQYYEGGSHAAGSLTLSGTISNQVITIAGVYYSWNAAVDTNAPDGSATHPWLANPGTDPLVAMANLLNFNGTRGVDFSSALGGPNTVVSGSSAPPSAQGTLTVSGGLISNQVIQIGNVYYTWGLDLSPAADGSAAAPWIAKLGVDNAASLVNMVQLINYTGTPGVDFSLAVAAASPFVSAQSTATTMTVTALVAGSGGNAIVSVVTSGLHLAWGGGTLSGGSASASVLTITARSDGTDGNAITTTVASGAGIAWGGATLTGGGIHVLHGVTVPDGQGVQTLAEVSSYVLVGIVNSQMFFWIIPGEVIIDPLNFAEKESNPDNIVDMLTVGDQVLITGQGSTENWYATGDQAAPMLPIEGRVYMRGTVDGTPVVVKDAVILVGDDGVVYEIGYSPGGTADWGAKRISDHGIEERIRILMRSEQGLTP